MKQRFKSLLIALLITATYQVRSDDLIPSLPSPSGNTTSSTSGKGDDDSSEQGRGGTSEQPEVPKPIDNSGPGSDRPARPDLPDHSRSGMSDAIKQLTEDFKVKAADFHKKQLELSQSLSDASREDRAKIREEIKANRAEFAQTKEDFRDQLRDVVAKLKEQKQKLDDEVSTRQSDRRGGKNRG